jgi:predicted  nucleic acid-binding Zn-ribbon protein
LQGTHRIVNIEPQIVALENLARIDEELAVLESELTQEQSALGEKRGQLEGLDQKLSSTAGSIGEMERLRNELIAEARQIGVQMERSREKLARCRTEREVNAAQREVEEVRKLYRDREIEIQKLGPLIEQARVDNDAIVEQRQAVSSELGESVGDAETKMGSLQTRATKLRVEREAAIKDVQPVLYRRYDMIRKRKGSGLCHTTDGTCSACHIQISPMLFQVLRRGDDFDRCPSCARILYYRPPAPDAGDEPPEGAVEASSGDGK